jgi:hypothetical protein
MCRAAAMPWSMSSAVAKPDSSMRMVVVTSTPLPVVTSPADSGQRIQRAFWSMRPPYFFDQ